MPSIVIRVKSNRYEFIGTREGRRTRFGILRADDLSFVPEISDLGEDEKAELQEKASKLEEILRNRTGQLAIGLTRQLAEFEAALGVSGPASADVMLDALDAALSSTLRKVRRMNELIVRRTAA